MISAAKPPAVEASKKGLLASADEGVTVQKERDSGGPLEALRVSEDFDGIVCDLDGVVYRGDGVIPGAPQAIARLRERGVHIVFCTNNSRLTLGQYVDKLARMGVSSVPEDVVTSGVVTSEVLARRGYKGATAMVVGDQGIRENLGDIGVRIHDGGGEQPGIDIVVVGWDVDFNYAKMRRAAAAVRGGAALIATNGDATFPAADELWPGAGAILASIEVASGRRAEIMGKPNTPMMEAAARRLEDAGSIAVVGDRPDSDLAGGEAMGWATILVLSGVVDAAEAAALDPQPDLIVESLADLG